MASDSRMIPDTEAEAHLRSGLLARHPWLAVALLLMLAATVLSVTFATRGAMVR